jgi:MFS family permease
MPLLPDLVAQSAPGTTTAARQAHISALAAAGPAGMMLAAPVWRLISDRTRRRPLLLFGLGGFALALAAMGRRQIEARLGLNLGAQYAATAAGQTLAALLTTWERRGPAGPSVWPAAATAIVLAGLLLEFSAGRTPRVEAMAQVAPGRGPA